MNTKLKIKVKKIVAPLMASRFRGRGQIIVLHRVLPDTSNERLRNTGIEINPQKLEDLILFFKKKQYAFISLEELSAYLQSKEKKRFVIFTLDDGYIDNLTYAYPIFKKFSVPFTIYVTTDFPDRKAVLWWYMLEELLMKYQHIKFNYQERIYEYSLNTISQKASAFEDLRTNIQQAGTSQLSLIQAIFEPFEMSLVDKVEKLALSWEELRQLQSDPLAAIEAHTVTHPSFKSLDKNEIVSEITFSVKRLEEKLNCHINHFAYPFGSSKEVGEREVEISRNCGIKTATTGRIGSIFTEHIHHLHSLPRLYVGPDTTWKQLEYELSGRSPFIRGANKRVVTV